MLIERICQNPACGHHFTIYQSEIRKGGGRYCSWSCRPKAYPRICQNPECCKTFLGIPSDMIKGRKRYCSSACRRSHLRNSWQERFWSHVARCDHEMWCPYCCWEWQLGTSIWGYGLFNLKTEGFKSARRAHRVAWELLNKQAIPAGLWGLHHCDNPPCCNPMHIYIGTAHDNSRDAVMRGRFHTRSYGQHARGEALPQSKLTETNVLEIVKRHRAGELHSVIAKDLEVSRATITLVVHGRIWRHITETLETVPDNVQIHNHVGERHTHAKLTNEKVRQIMALFLQGHTMTALAQQFFVDYTTILAIVRRKTWKHIPWPTNAVQLSLFEE
jgi:HNH endonuclease